MLDRSFSLRLSTFLLLSSMLSFPVRGAADPNPKIGRYETDTKECSYTDSTQDSVACITLQLKGRSPSVVAVRLIGHGTTKNSRRQLTFVTLTTQGESPLTCSAGTCRLRCRVLAKRGLKRGRGHPSTPKELPRAYPKLGPLTSGECRLKETEF